MTEKELLKKFNVALREFSPDEWNHSGFFDSINRIIYINSALSKEERYKVLLHELGHLDHYSDLYKHAPLLCENEANRFMIHNLVADELATNGQETFNYVHFMKKHKLKTITDELMIQDEFHKLAGGF